jgi:3-deoxy-D-manno-octulosonic-acid transferase
MSGIGTRRAGWRERLRAQLGYACKIYLHLPVTFLKRVLFGREPYWRAYFWNKWGFVCGDLSKLAAGKRLIWVDVLSGGEVMQIFSFVRILKGLLPDHDIVVSTNNKYSYDVAKGMPEVAYVFDTPWDLRHAVRRALKRVRPDGLVCIENAPFPVLLRQAQKMGVRTILCSGFMSKDYHRHENLWRAVPLGSYHHLDFVGAKSQEDAAGFVRMGVRPDKIAVVGNMRFDPAFQRLGAAEKEELRRNLRIPDGCKVFVAGSVRAKEEAVILEAFARAKQRYGNLFLLFAPSFFSPELNLAGTADKLGLKTTLRSKIDGRARVDADLLIVDTFGELSRLYSLADFIFIGGSLNPASRLGYGNNIIEPLVHARPIFFGPHMNRWTEITESLMSVYPGLKIRSASELAENLIFLMNHEEVVRALEERALSIVRGNGGAPRKNAEFVRDALRSTAR